VYAHTAWFTFLEEIVKTNNNQKCLYLYLSIFDQRIRILELGRDQQNSFINTFSNLDLGRWNLKLVLSFGMDPLFDAIWNLGTKYLKILVVDVS